MSQIMIEMAQRAGQNEALCAGLIRKYGDRRNMQWEQIAGQLNMDSERLAKLALCRSPRPGHLAEEAEKLAAYLGVEKSGLLRFFEANLPPTSVKPGWLEKGRDKVNTMVPKRYVFALAVAAIVFLVSAVIAFSAQPPSATLAVISGQVTVQTAGQPELVFASGQTAKVKTGDNLAIKPGATAQLRFFDGSTMDLAENTRLEVQELATSDAQFRVRLHMLAGRTVSRVLRVLGAGDAYEVSTPSSTVSVRGTVFVVQVIDQDTTYVGCDKGVVSVVSGNQQAEVKAGEELTIQASQKQPPVIEPKPTKEPPTPEIKQPEASPSTGAVPSLAPVMNSPVPPAVAPTATSVPPPTATPIIAPNGALSTPGAAVVSPASSGPQGTPNKPSQVPGKPPSQVSGKGNPPAGGAANPGNEGGDPPGQTKDKPDKGKGKTK